MRKHREALSIRLFAVLLGLCLGGPGTGWGYSETVYGTASVIFPWLNSKNDARSVAMAGIASALPGEVNNLTVNPASLGSLKGQQLALMHYQGVIRGSAQEHVAYGLNLGGHGLGVSVDYINFATIQNWRYDSGSDRFVKDGTMNPHGYSVAAGYGKALGDWSVGLAAKMAKQDLIVEQIDAYAGDLGLRWQPLAALAVAASLQNLGPQVYGFNLPTTFRAALLSNFGLGGPLAGAPDAGMAPKAAASAPGAGLARHAFNVGLDLVAPWADSRAISVGLGLEYTLMGSVALRGGYTLGGPAAATGPAAGAGLKLGVVRLDYAWESFMVTSGTQRLSGVIEF